MRAIVNYGNSFASLMAALLFGSILPPAHAAPSATISFADTVGDANATTLAPGKSSFDIGVRLTTSDSFQGFSLFLKDKGYSSGPARFTLTNRVIADPNFFEDPDTIVSDSSFKDAGNAGRDVDAMTFDVGYIGDVTAGGAYDLMKLTLTAAPGIAGGTYVLALNAASNLTTGSGGEMSYDPPAEYSVLVIVPEPVSIVWVGVGLLFLRRRSRRVQCVGSTVARTIAGGSVYANALPTIIDPMTTYTASDSRYENPSDWFRRCGRSGLLLPAISLGCWHNFGGAGTDAARHADDASLHENCRRMLFTAFDHGITHFDLANNYGPPPGSAEERVGRILRDDFKPYRDELIVSSKAGYRMWPGPYGEWGSRKSLIASCEASLKRLRLDYVDVFYSHRPDPNTPLEETLGALDTLVRQGKTIYAGISSYSGAQTADTVRVCEINHLVKPVIHQPRYSMLDRRIEQDLLPITERFGVGTIAFCPLAQGLLTGKYLKAIPNDSRAKTGGFLKESSITPELVVKLNKLNSIALGRGQSIAQMALAWTLRPQGDTSVTTALIGASRPEQIVENVKYRDRANFTADELKLIEGALAS